MSQDLEIYNPLRDFDIDSLAPITADLSDVQIGYVAIGTAKEILQKELTTKELEIQNIVNATKKMICAGELAEMQKTLQVIKDNYALVKSNQTKLEDQRKQFTGFITAKVITPLMEFEKRSQKEIDTLTNHEFTQRKAVGVKEAAANAIIEEIANYKAHVTNQYFIQGETHRKELQTHTLKAYELALTKPFPKDIAKYKKDLAEQLRTKEMSYKFIRFNRVLVVDDEAQKIIDSIEAYDKTEDVQAAIDNIETVFAMYEQDKKNASAVVVSIQEEVKETETKAAESIEIETTTNKIIASGSVGSFSTTAKIKIKVEVVEENTSAYALAVLTAFMKNFADCTPFLKVRDWGNLKISQMADALAKLATENRTTDVATGKVYTGLTLKHIEK